MNYKYPPRLFRAKRDGKSASRLECSFFKCECFFLLIILKYLNRLFVFLLDLKDRVDMGRGGRVMGRRVWDLRTSEIGNQ